MGLVGYESKQTLEIKREEQKFYLKGLVDLIENCLDMNYRNRPNFEEIAWRMKDIENEFNECWRIHKDLHYLFNNPK